MSRWTKSRVPRTRRRLLPLGLLAVLTSCADAPAEQRVLYEKQSPYNTILVTEDDDGLRTLRFERGVDPEGQGRAVERATELLLSIAGGSAGPLVVDSSAEHLPKREPILLRKSRLAR